MGILSLIGLRNVLDTVNVRRAKKIGQTVKAQSLGHSILGYQIK